MPRLVNDVWVQSPVVSSLIGSGLFSVISELVEGDNMFDEYPVSGLIDDMSH